MKTRLTIQGYRGLREPTTIELGDGNVALIGPNNAGKSTVLRCLFEFRNLLGSLVNMIGPGGTPRTLTAAGVRDIRQVFPRGSTTELRVEIELADETPPHELRKLVLLAQSTSASFFVTAMFGDDILVNAGQQIPGNIQGNAPSVALMQVACQHMSEARYYGALRSANAVGGGGKHFDLDVGQPLVAMWHTWRAGDQIEADERARLVTKMLSEIFDLPGLQIYPSQDGADLYLEFSGQRHFLSEMGFGMSQFVCVLMNAARDRPSMILIDEPESNLHASLQLKFFNALNRFTDSIVFSTHSVGLARQVANRIYSFTPVNGTIKVRHFQDPKFLNAQLGELSFSAHREVGFKKLLLVEGPTEIQLFQTILQTLSMGSTALLLNLGGDSGINGNVRNQLEEIFSVVDFDATCPNVIAIIDSEKQSFDAELATNRREFEALLALVGVPLCILSKRAIENYFTKIQLDSAGINVAPLADFEKPPRGWDKNKNFKAAAAMSKDEVLATDFGQFLQQHLA